MAQLTITQDESGNYYVIDKQGNWIASGNSYQEAKDNGRQAIKDANKLFDDDED